MKINKNFWKNKRVLITGNTGFKGTWLSIWLNLLESNLLGYSLKPPTTPSLFFQSGMNKKMKTVEADIRNKKKLFSTIKKFNPDIIFHMAAQPLVIESYKDPIKTYETNFNGTLNLLECVREIKRKCTLIIITSDKCYENTNKKSGYRENDKMGGYDPYSCSKGIVELLVNSYSKSFFLHNNKTLNPSVTVRSGNVIGGGDWSENRLIPDAVKSFKNNKALEIRYPNATRPWQHVLEPLSGYMDLARKLHLNPKKYSGAWNFGPKISQVKSVNYIISRVRQEWIGPTKIKIKKGLVYNEANQLSLNCSKANQKLRWKPKWKTDQAISKTIKWYKKYLNREDLYNACLSDINDYIS